MDEPAVDAVVDAAPADQLPKEGGGTPQPTDIQDELRKLQSAKDREIAAVTRQNQELAARVEVMEQAEARARIQAIEDPEERANAVIGEERKRLDRERADLQMESEVRAKPIVMAMLSAQYGVPVEVLQPARSAVEMENLALRYKLEHADKELKKAAKPEAPAATGQKFAQGAGQAPSSYDPSKFRGTGDIAGSLRAKREAGL